MTSVPHHDVAFIPPSGARPQAVAEARERWLHAFMLPGENYDRATLAGYLGTTPKAIRMQFPRMEARGLIARVGNLRPFVYTRI